MPLQVETTSSADVPEWRMRKLGLCYWILRMLRTTMTRLEQVRARRKQDRSQRLIGDGAVH